MITLTEYKSVMEEIKELNPDITSLIFSPTESHAIKKLSGKAGVVMVCTYPMALSKPSVNEDNYGDSNQCFIFILEKQNPDKTPDEEITAFDSLLSTAKNIKTYMAMLKAEVDNIFGGLVMTNIKTEPEYQIFGGFNGYSIGFELIDNEL